jgi:hypothetical protein
LLFLLSGQEYLVTPAVAYGGHVEIERDEGDQRQCDFDHFGPPFVALVGCSVKLTNQSGCWLHSIYGISHTLNISEDVRFSDEPWGLTGHRTLG